MNKPFEIHKNLYTILIDPMLFDDDDDDVVNFFPKRISFLFESNFFSVLF